MLLSGKGGGKDEIYIYYFVKWSVVCVKVPCDGCWEKSASWSGSLREECVWCSQYPKGDVHI